MITACKAQTFPVNFAAVFDVDQDEAVGNIKDGRDAILPMGDRDLHGNQLEQSSCQHGVEHSTL
jgi:hypothetical protein